MKKITLITGAGRGIGEAIALKFALENHKLILLVQKHAQQSKLIQKLKKFNIEPEFFVGNLKDKKFIKILEKKIPKIDNIVNNAAVANTKYFTKVTDNELDEMLDVNLKIIFKLSQIFSKK